MSRRPRLKAHCRPLLRDDGTVQLGTDAERAVRVAGLTAAERGLLLEIDGTREVGQLLEDGARSGVPEERVQRLLSLLDTHGATVLEPADRADLAALPRGARDLLAPDAETVSALDPRSSDGYAILGRRAGRSVLLVGAGPTTGSLAAVLVRAGVGAVARGRYAAEAAEWATEGATDPPGPRVGRRAGEPGETASPDAVVLAGNVPPPPAAGARWQRRGVPHLPLVVSTTGAGIGPLVLPGRTPCLLCHELTRRDLDPSWPGVRTQLSVPGVSPETPVRAETTLAAVAAGLTAMVLLAHLDGLAQPAGVSLHVDLPWPVLRERHWPVHPRCGCVPAPEGPGGTAPEPTFRPRGTMAE